VERGDANDATFVGVEAGDDDAFDRVVARLRAAGTNVSDGDADDLQARRVARLARADAPWGVPVEIVVALDDAAVPFDSLLVRGGFVPEAVGFGHVVFATTEFDGSHRFLGGGLGFVQSGWLEMERAPGIALEVRFYPCNARHHPVALAKAPFE